MADTTVKLKADISNLKSQMQAAARQVKLANSEFKAAASGMDDWSRNADGLRAKLKQLDSVLQSQKTRLSLLEDEYEKTKQLYGENSAQADKVKISINNMKAAINKTQREITNYNQDLTDCENETGKFANETDESTEAMKSAGAEAGNLGDGFTVMKGVLADLVASGIKACIDGLKDLAQSAFEAYQAFDEGQDNMIKKTGATGEALEQLTENYTNVMKSVLTDSDSAGNAIGEIKTKFGLTGEALENLSEKFIKFADLNNTDVVSSIDAVQSASEAWGVSSEDVGDLLDLLNKTSQQTGASVDSLASSLTTNAASLKDMNFNVEEAVSFIGQLETSGVDSASVMAALKKALANAAKDGKTTAEALSDLQKAMEDSESSSEATVAAMELFGAKAGPAIAEACQSGRINFNELGSAMTDYQGNIDTTYDATLDGVDKIKLAWQGIRTEVGAEVGALLDDISPDIEEVVSFGKEKAKDLINYIKSNSPEIKERVKDVLNFVQKSFTWIIENFGEIKAIGKTVGTILLATFAVNKIVSFVQIIGTVITTIRTMKTAIEAAETAQLLLNAAQLATPVGVVTAAVAGLAAGVLYLVSRTDEATESTARFNEQEQEQINKINELSSAYADMRAVREENISAIEGEFTHYSELATELDSLIDANGRVKAGYEDRVNFILTTLNEACGTEMQLVDGVIENYKEEKATLDKLLQTKKAEAVLRANEELYTTAVQNQTDALNNLTTAQGIFAQKKSELANAEKEYQKIMNTTAEEYAEQNNLTWDLGAAAQQLENDQEELGQKFLEAKAAVGESRVAMETAQTTYDDYMSTIQNYEGLSSAIIAGDADKIQIALVNLQNDFKTAENSTRSSLERQLQNYQSNLASLEAAIRNGTPGVTQEMVSQARSMVNAAQAELDKAPANFSTKANSTASQYAAAIGSTDNQELARSGAKSVSDAANEGLEEGADQAETAGDNFTAGYINGMEISLPDVSSTAEGMSSDAVDSLNSGQQSNSPSRATQSSGENFAQGYINGMNNKNSAVYNAAYNMARTAWNALKKGQQEGSPSKLTFQSGVYFVQGYMNGIVSQNKQLQKTAQQMVGTVLKEIVKLGSYNFDAVTANASSKFSEAISKKIDYALSRMQYENEGKIAAFDNAIEKYEKQRENASNKIENKSEKVVSGYEKQLEKERKQLEKQRDADVKAVQKRRDNDIKAAEKARDTQIRSLEKERDRNIKAIEKSSATEIRDIEKNRDKKIKALEKERDKKVNNLQSQLDNLSYKSENAAQRKRLQQQIKDAKDEANKKITTVKNNADKEIKASKNSAAKATKQEQSNTAKEIIAIKRTSNEIIKSEKSTSNKEINSIKSNANKEIKQKEASTKKAVDAEKASAEKQIKANDKKYNKLIENEKKNKEAYQTASSQMISAYQNALQEYQSKAENLINDTINGITENYSARYEELIGKQDELINKLKSAGDLFDISGAGVMTINDIQAQTKQINEYASKLQKIKNKVSSELFDAIASFDMKEGAAYIDRLLAMSAKDLSEYNKAYSEKMKAAEKAGESIYNSDIKKVSVAYQNEINKAFKDLPKQLEELGVQTMKGFVLGLTNDTDYMSKKIKIYINSMLSTFKKQLGIQSPSKLMMKIGDYTGEGFVIGLKDTINNVRAVASELAKSAAVPLEDLQSDINLSKSTANAPGQNGAVGIGGSTVVNNYYLTQNNTSPKSLSALDTYQARRQQIAMVKAIL